MLAAGSEPSTPTTGQGTTAPSSKRRQANLRVCGPTAPAGEERAALPDAGSRHRLIRRARRAGVAVTGSTLTHGTPDGPLDNGPMTTPPYVRPSRLVVDLLADDDRVRVTGTALRIDADPSPGC